MMRVGPFKPVHVKTMVAQQQRMLLASPKLSQAPGGGVRISVRGNRRTRSISCRGEEDTSRLRDDVAVPPCDAARIAAPSIAFCSVLQ